MHTTDHREAGWWPLQDHDPKSSLTGRQYMGGERVTASSTDLANPLADGPNTQGDICGGLLVEERDGKRDYLHGWWLTGCSVINTDSSGAETVERGDGGWVPQLRAGVADLRFKGLDPQFHHPILDDQIWPGAWTGLMSAGSIETEQVEILHPDFLGIVAPYRGAPGRAGTPVFDLTPAGELDPERWARAQTSWAPIPLTPRTGCAPGNASARSGVLAWMLGTARDGILTGGLVVDSGARALAPPPEDDQDPGDIPGPDETRVGGVSFPGGEPPVSLGDGTQTGGDVVVFGGTRTVERTPRVGTQAGDPDPNQFKSATGGNVLACVSTREGGYLEVGDVADRHRIGVTADGEPINAAHISTSVLFRGGRWDCGAEFDQEDYKETVDGNVWVPTFFRVDPRRSHITACGTFPDLGRWQTKTVVYIPEPPTETPPPPEKPPPPPLTPPPHPPRTPRGPDDGLPTPEGGEGEGDGGGSRLDDGVPRPDGSEDFIDVDEEERRLDEIAGGRLDGSGLLDSGGNLIGPSGIPPGKEFPKGFGELQPDESILTGNSLLSLAVPGLAFKAQSQAATATDFRCAREVSTDDRRAHDRNAPVALQAIAVSQQNGGEFVHQVAPGLGRYPGGAALGGVIFAPPDVDEAAIGVTSAIGALGGTYCALRPDVVGGFGYPATDGGSLVSGWREYMSAGDRVFLPVDASGGADTSVQATFQSSVHITGAGGGRDEWSFNPHDGYGKLPMQTLGIAAAAGTVEPGASFGQKVWFEERTVATVAVGPIYLCAYTSSDNLEMVRTHQDPENPEWTGTLTADGLTGNIDTDLLITVGSKEGVPNNLVVQADDAQAASGDNGGDLLFHTGAGDGAGVDGNFIIYDGGGTPVFTVAGETGKMTVTGLIDPTGVKMTEQSADPGATAAGEGTFWVKDDVPSVPYFTDDDGVDHELLTSGSAQPQDDDLTAIAGLTGTGYLRRIADDTWTLTRQPAAVDEDARRRLEQMEAPIRAVGLNGHQQQRIAAMLR